MCACFTYIDDLDLGHAELAAARALWERIQFSNIMVPPEFSLIPSPTDADADADVSRAREKTPASPIKSGRSMSPLKSAGNHRRQRSSMNPNRTAVEQFSVEARVVEDLELLASTFDAFEKWGNLCSEYLRCVSSFLFAFTSC